jgi:hypothetical protein
VRDFPRDAGHHSLVLARRRHAVEASSVGLDHTGAQGLGARQEVASASVLARAVDEDLKDRLRLVTQLGENGVKAVDEPQVACGLRHLNASGPMKSV